MQRTSLLVEQHIDNSKAIWHFLMIQTQKWGNNDLERPKWHENQLAWHIDKAPEPERDYYQTRSQQHKHLSWKSTKLQKVNGIPQPTTKTGAGFWRKLLGVSVGEPSFPQWRHLHSNLCRSALFETDTRSSKVCTHEWQSELPGVQHKWVHFLSSM